MTKKQSETQSPQAQATEQPKFFEIVNWKKLQSMDKADVPWLKFYTSVLNNDKIDSLDDQSYRLITNIWALAARLGKHILPADPKWLMKQIPYLREEPDLTPLFETRNMYGHPDPFLRLCQAPEADGLGEAAKTQPAGDSVADGGSDGTAGKKRADQKPAAEKDPLYEKAVALVSSCAYASARKISEALNIKYDRARGIVKSMAEAGLVGEYVPRKGRKVLRAARTLSEVISESQKLSFQPKNPVSRADREEKRRGEEIRAEKETKTEDDPAPLRASDHFQEERKSLTGFTKEEQSTADQSSPGETQRTADKSSSEPEKPVNPTKSDAGQAGSGPHHVPRPARSAARRGPEAIGDVIGRRFEPWWGDADCEAFGWEIVEALGFSTDRLNLQSRNQWGNFAAWWWRVRQSAPVGVLGELRAKALDKANEYRLKRRRHVRNPGAWWTDVMGKELASHGVRLPDERAGPAAASI